ncbi:MAG: type II toxin-antitoxin system VapC family toxin [Gemmatimonadaceae bacterium]
MIVYAESSAILAWLLGEPSQEVAIRAMEEAELVVTSSLTGVECARGLSRARATGRVSGADELAALRLLDVAERSWDIHDLSDRVMSLARSSFPVEPVRTLDAMHLATAMIFQEALGEVIILSFDDRVRENAIAMGFVVLPG